MKGTRVILNTASRIMPEDHDPTIEKALYIINGIKPLRERLRIWLKHAACASPFCSICVCAECGLPFGMDYRHDHT